MDKPPIFRSLFNKETHEQITIRCAFHTEASERHPKRNEDTILADEKNRTYGIFDGMGGHISGDVASQTARDYIQTHLPEIQNGVEIKTAEAFLQKIMERADIAVYEKSEKENSDDNAEYAGIQNKKEGMGTTASVFKIHTDEKGKNWGMIANVGDSRIYKIGKDGKVQPITIDDDLLRKNEFNLGEEELRKIAKKIAEARKPEELNNMETYYFNNRNLISKCMGKRDEFSDVYSIPVKKGDRFLLTSDGIHDILTTEDLGEIIRDAATIENAVVDLIQESISGSKKTKKENMRTKQDDMSAVLIEIK